MKGWVDLVERIDRSVPVDVFLVIALRKVEREDLRGSRGVVGSTGSGTVGSGRFLRHQPLCINALQSHLLLLRGQS